MRSDWRVTLFVVGMGILLAGGGPLHAADSSLGSLQSFADVLERALQESPVVERSHWQAVQAEASLQELDAALRPQLQFSGEHNRQAAGLNPLSALQGWQSDDVLWDTQAALTIVQQLGANWQLQGGLNQAQLGVELADIQSSQAVIDVMLEVQQSYLGVLQAHAAWELAELNAANAKANLAVAEDRRRQASATELDVLRERNTVYQAETQLEQAKSGFRVAALRLLQLVAQDVDQPEETLLSWAAQQRRKLHHDVQPWLPVFDAAWEYAQRQRTDLRSLDKQVQLAEIRRDTAAGGRDWSVSLSGTYLLDDYVMTGSVNSDRTLMATLARRWQTEREASGWPLPELDWDAIDLDEEDLPDWLKNWFDELAEMDQAPAGEGSNPWQLGLSVSYRFGDGGAGRAEIQRLEAAVQEAVSQSRSAEQLVYLDVYNAHQRLLQTHRAWVSAVEHRGEVNETLQRMEQMLERGVMAQRDMDEGQLLLLSAELQVMQGFAEFKEQQARFAAAVGLGIDEVRHGLVHGTWPGF